jgi:hypothetical protein
MSCESCSCPICPDDPCAQAIWYPGEDVCRKPSKMTKTMRKITRAVGKSFDRGCYTAAMLEGLGRVGKKIQGLNAENEISPERVAAWLSKHKGGTMSEARKAEYRARALAKGLGALGFQRSESPAV